VPRAVDRSRTAAQPRDLPSLKKVWGGKDLPGEGGGDSTEQKVKRLARCERENKKGGIKCQREMRLGSRAKERF